MQFSHSSVELFRREDSRNRAIARRAHKICFQCLSETDLIQNMEERLSRRYKIRDGNDDLSYINSIMKKQPTHSYSKTQILYRDLAFLDSSQECMKAYVESFDYQRLLQSLTEYYRYMKDTPTLYMKWHGKILNKYNDLKKIMSYMKLKGELQQPKQSSPIQNGTCVLAAMKTQNDTYELEQLKDKLNRIVKKNINYGKNGIFVKKNNKLLKDSQSKPYFPDVSEIKPTHFLKVRTTNQRLSRKRLSMDNISPPRHMTPRMSPDTRHHKQRSSQMLIAAKSNRQSPTTMFKLPSKTRKSHKKPENTNRRGHARGSSTQLQSPPLKNNEVPKIIINHHNYFNILISPKAKQALRRQRRL